MKKLVILLLLPLLLLQIGGLLLFYTMQQTAERLDTWQQVAEGKGEFVTIKTSIDAYRKGKQNEHEAVLNGRLFDIKSGTITGDSVEIIAFNDTEEEEIIRKINCLFNDLSNRTPNSTSQKFFKLFKTTAVCPPSFDLQQPLYKGVIAHKRRFLSYKDKLLMGKNKSLLKPPIPPKDFLNFLERG